MPTYIYECAKCGDELEVWQSFADDPLKKHTGGCGGKLAKVIQPVGIVLKGSGFYRNDSRGAAKRSNGDRGSDSSSESTSSTPDTSKPDKKSDATSAPKSDTSSSSGNGSKGSPAKTPASSSSK